MVSFTPVNPGEVRNARVSAPLLEAFMKSGHKMARVESDQHEDSTKLRPVLTAYIKSHNLPIELFARVGVLYMERTDLDDNGNSLTPDILPETKEKTSASF